MADKKIIQTILGSGTTDKSVIGQAILEALKTEEAIDDKAELLAVALVERDSVPKLTSTLPNKGIPAETWETLNRTHSDFVNSFLKFAFFNSASAQEFSTEIVKMIALLQTDESRAYALGIIIHSDYIPYRQLDALNAGLPDNVFGQVLQANSDKTDLIKYIARLPFSRGTDMSACLLSVLDEIDDKNLRISLLGLYFLEMKNSLISAIQNR